MSTATHDETEGTHGRGEPAPGSPEASAHDHPSDFDYFKVFIFLVVVTAIEVALYYVDMSTTALVIALLPLMVVKFAVVALWFMHLRFDSRLFRHFFVAGIVLAIAVYLVALLTFQVFD